MCYLHVSLAVTCGALWDASAAVGGRMSDP